MTPTPPPTHLQQALDSGRFVVTCELSPPKGTNLEPLREKARLLAPRVDAFNLTDSHAARMAMTPLAAAARILDLDAEPVLQLTTRDRNRIALQADLLGAAALGVRNVVFMGGDPPRAGDHPDAKPVFDVFSSQILAAARGLGAGRDMAGNALDGPAHLFLGAVVNPGAAEPEAEARRMHEKVEAGARFFQTQAVYDPDAFERFVRAAGDPGVPVLAGVLVLKSAGMADYLNAHVPGIRVPDAILEEIARAPDPAAAGLEIAARTVRTLRPLCRGVHLMALGRERELPALLDRAGLDRPRA